MAHATLSLVLAACGLTLAPHVAAAAVTRVLFVSAAANPPASDRPIVQALTANGFSVSPVDDDAFDVSDVTGDVAAIVISTSVSPAKIGAFVRTTAVPVVLWEPFAYPKLGLTSATARGETAPQTAISITAPAHPIAAGLSGTVAVTSSARPLSFGRPGAGATVIARAAAAPGDPTVFAYDTGAPLVGGGTAPARRVALFPSFATPPVLTNAGRSLVVAAVRWATAVPPTPPVDTPATIDVWHGDSLVVRLDAWGQTFVNILGRARDPDGIASASYSLNGGAPIALSLGPNQRRLVDPGDFNVDLPVGSVLPGANQVVISVVDVHGRVTTRPVTLIGAVTGPVPIPYTADWSTVTVPDTVATAVDGRWTVRPGTGLVESSNPGYDRILVLGDRSWTNYEVFLSFTVSQFVTPGPLSGVPGVGVIVNWNGHNNSVTPGSQPLQGYRPLAGSPTPYGAIMWWRRSALTITDHDLATVATSAQPMAVGTTMRLRAQVDRVGATTVYRARMWPASSAEPAIWEASWTAPVAPDEATSGSMGLLAHEALVSFGRVQITPIP